jgi:hypothetical protein
MRLAVAALGVDVGIHFYSGWKGGSRETSSMSKILCHSSHCAPETAKRGDHFCYTVSSGSDLVAQGIAHASLPTYFCRAEKPTT